MGTVRKSFASTYSYFIFSIIGDKQVFYTGDFRGKHICACSTTGDGSVSVIGTFCLNLYLMKIDFSKSKIISF